MKANTVATIGPLESRQVEFLLERCTYSKGTPLGLGHKRYSTVRCIAPEKISMQISGALADRGAQTMPDKILKL